MKKNLFLKNSQKVEDRGFFVGINTQKSTINTLNYVAKNIGAAFPKVVG